MVLSSAGSLTGAVTLGFPVSSEFGTTTTGEL